MFAPSLLEPPALGHEHLLREGDWGGTQVVRIRATGWGSQSPGEGFCEHQGSGREVKNTSIHSPADIPWGFPAGSVALWEPPSSIRTALPLGHPQEDDTLSQGSVP